MKKTNPIKLIVASSFITTSFLAGCASQANNIQSATTPTPNQAQNSTTTTQALPDPTGKVPVVPNSVTATTLTYRDGTYNESAAYYVEEINNSESVTFAFTIKDDQITGVELSSKSANPVSEKFQNMFMDGIKQQVVGLKIDQIGKFDVINGSSLTPVAFNEAITTLKKQAKA